jgi:hypothetical protein
MTGLLGWSARFWRACVKLQSAADAGDPVAMNNLGILPRSRDGQTRPNCHTQACRRRPRTAISNMGATPINQGQASAADDGILTLLLKATKVGGRG